MKELHALVYCSKFLTVTYIITRKIIYVLIDQPQLSIVVPLYNEQDSVPLLHQKICEAVDPMGIAYEILFVNDGSQDRTFEVASGIAQSDPKLRVIELRKNYGQTPAMAAGIDTARGKVLATMDGDLQNDPSDIPMMFAKLHEGYDIVVGWRHKRQDKLITRKIPSSSSPGLIVHAGALGCAITPVSASDCVASPSAFCATTRNENVLVEVLMFVVLSSSISMSMLPCS